MKKILKMIIIGVLCFGFAFSAFACENTGISNENSTTESSEPINEPQNEIHYNAVKIEYPEADMKLEYCIANRTKGNYYDFEKQCLDEQCPDRNDDSLPETRTYVMTSQLELDNAFSEFPETDFEKEMVIVYFYLEWHTFWEQRLESVMLDEEQKLQIQFVVSKPKDLNPSLSWFRRPMTGWVAIKMDKIGMDSIEFVRREEI